MGQVVLSVWYKYKYCCRTVDTVATGTLSSPIPQRKWLTIYYVNKNFVNLVRLFLPLGVALLSGFFLESMATVKNLSFAFLIVGLVSNYYYPEIICIEEKKLKLKLTLSKKYQEFSLDKIQISVDNRARYLILHLNHKYLLDVKTLPVELYYRLKPYIKIKQE